jgi:hypothetical protein
LGKPPHSIPFPENRTLKPHEPLWTLLNLFGAPAGA